MDLQIIVQIITGIWFIGVVTYFIYKNNQIERQSRNLK